MNNSEKIILDLCGGTGAWSKPYKDAGYDVRLITLPDYDVLTYQPPDNVYGILAAPPCLEFSLARNGINVYMTEAPQRNIEAGLEIVRACQRIVNESNPKFSALENPVGLKILREYLGIPRFKFQPWQFGDPWTKYTSLWGNFKIPIVQFVTQKQCALYVGDIKQYFKVRKLSAPIRKGKLLPSKADIDETCFKFTGMKAERSAFRSITVKAIGLRESSS